MLSFATGTIGRYTVCVSSVCTGSESTKQAEGISKHRNDTNSSELARKRMVSRSARNVDRSSSRVTNEKGSTETASRSQISQEPPEESRRINETRKEILELAAATSTEVDANIRTHDIAAFNSAQFKTKNAGTTISTALEVGQDGSAIVNTGSNHKKVPERSNLVVHQRASPRRSRFRSEGARAVTLY